MLPKLPRKLGAGWLSGKYRCEVQIAKLLMLVLKIVALLC